MKLTPMMHTDAVALFKSLIRKYGTRWDVLIPPEAHAQLAQCNKVLSQEDRKVLLEELAKEPKSRMCGCGFVHESHERCGPY